MGVDNFTMNYNQMGLIATVELEEVLLLLILSFNQTSKLSRSYIDSSLQTDENVVAWQRFLPDGVIALLPLTSNLSSIVWSADTKMVKDLLQLPEPAFVDAVNQAFVCP